MTDTTYITGVRRWLCNKIMKTFSWLILSVMGIHVNKKVLSQADVDYSFYLGQGYKAPSLSQGRTSKIIAPHVSCFDIQALNFAFHGDVCFLAGAFVKSIPGLGRLAQLLGTVFVPRSGSKSELSDTLNSLLQRTEQVETKGEFPPLVIFPEGTCSNNVCLTKFRRGAFFDLRRVTPVTLKYKYGMVHPAIEAIDEPLVVFLMCCAVQVIELDLKQLPDFVPNEYLYATHADKGAEKWEIFAWACRDVMAKVGGFGKHDIPFKDKNKVYEYYMGRIDSLTFENGVTVEYRPDGVYDENRSKKEQ